mmetsp:Transcript_161374/g.297712  ORF Transcript_161374/g.297712 Transcript_161374/m.297712 type:complete len:223 (+) Transcript_161374:498-1166(+)
MSVSPTLRDPCVACDESIAGWLAIAFFKLHFRLTSISLSGHAANPCSTASSRSWKGLPEASSAATNRMCPFSNEGSARVHVSASSNAAATSPSFKYINDRFESSLPSCPLDDLFSATRSLVAATPLLSRAMPLARRSIAMVYRWTAFPWSPLRAASFAISWSSPGLPGSTCPFGVLIGVCELASSAVLVGVCELASAVTMALSWRRRAAAQFWTAVDLLQDA